MIRIGILGDIGSGKSFVAKSFGYPIFNADNEVAKILNNKNNIKKITKIVHPLIRKKMNLFLLKNKKSKLVILDIPLLLENKINNKNMILVFVDAKKADISRRLSKRKGFNSKIAKTLKEIQLPLDYKKRKSQYIIKNFYTKKILRKSVKTILRKILK